MALDAVFLRLSVADLGKRKRLFPSKSIMNKYRTDMKFLYFINLITQKTKNKKNQILLELQ